MKISIVTVSFNSERTIRDTLNSVASQSWQNIEHIVIDGESSDNTLQILSEYPHISKIISEPDQGIYDAMNKGINVATGEVVMILNSDDVYDNNKVIETYAKIFTETNADSVYADLVYVNENDLSKVTRHWVSGTFDRKRFESGWMPPHPTFAVKRKTYMDLGAYNTTMVSAADYELMLRFLYKNNISAKYNPITAIRMRNGGISNRSVHNRLNAHRDDRRAWQINKLTPKPYTLILKPLSKLSQFKIV